MYKCNGNDEHAANECNQILIDDISSSNDVNYATLRLILVTIFELRQRGDLCSGDLCWMLSNCGLYLVACPSCALHCNYDKTDMLAGRNAASSQQC